MHPPLANTADVIRIDFDPYSQSCGVVDAAMRSRAADRLGEQDRRPTVQQPVGLNCSPVDGHPGGKAIVSNLGEFNAEMIDGGCAGHCLESVKGRTAMPDGSCHGRMTR
jgi:hypothetical protein